MKKTIYTLMIVLLLCSAYANAQLSVGSSSLNIKSGTIFSIQGLVFTPSADVSMASNTVSFSGTAITNGSDQSINRVYSFASPLSSYSGLLGIQYSAGELNGNTESDLQLAYNPLSSGGSFVVTGGSTTGSPGSYYVSNTLDSKNLGKVTALPSVTTADAGGDKTICESATSYTLVDASATLYDDVTWTTSGSGTWNGTENTVQATYYPSQEDKDDESGFVTLTISANKTGSATPTTDNMNLYFQAEPTADAGTDKSVCENGVYTTDDASSANYTSVTWTTTGDGTLNNENSLKGCTYQPGTSDKTAGSFSLTLEAGNPYCGSVSSTVTVQILKQPTADAGSDVTICETETHQLNGQVTNADSYAWFHTLGNGSLSSTTVLDPTFTPCTTCGYTDSHEEWFTLSAQPIDPCATAAEDIVKITVWAEPVADAGLDQGFCDGTTTTTLEGAADNANSYSWSIVSGAGGSLISPNSLTTEFSGVLGTTYVLMLTVSNPACTSSSFDYVNISFSTPFTTGAITGNSLMVLYPFTSSGNYSPSVISANLEDAPMDFSNLEEYTIGNDGHGTVLETYPVCDATNYELAATLDSYFTLTLNALEQMDLDSLVFEVGKGGSADPRGFFVRSSVDAYATDLISETMPSGQPAPARKSIALGAAYDGISTVTFRFYVFTPDCYGNSVDWRNIAVEYGTNAGETICIGGDPALISSVEAANGGDEEITYKWQSSTDEAFTSPTDIPFSNSATYDPPSGFTEEIWYRRLAHDGECSTEFAPSDGVWKISIQEEPVADAGKDDETCEGIPYYLYDASADNYSSVSWTTSGSGSFTNGDQEKATYNPGFGETGEVTLTLYADPVDPCSGQDSDDMTLTIVAMPDADAGVDATICENETYTLDATLANYSSISWSTAGDGTFSDSGIEDPVYTPGENDITLGEANLTVTLGYNDPCSEPGKGSVSNTDDMSLTIVKNPIADAGEDDTECAGNTYTLDGSAENQTQVSWSIVSGAGGVLYAPNSLTSTFTGTSGTTYILQLTASNDYCESATDNVEITFQPIPTVNAGEDATSCTDTPYYLEDATATNYESVSWSTTGGGTFDDHTTVKATYTPAATDYPFAMLTLVAQPIDPCTTEAESSMKLTMGRAPEVDAGEDASICESGYQLDGSYVSGQGSLWTTFGDGTFSNPNVLDPYYTPGTADLAAGQVKLSLVVSPISPCTTLHNDDLYLYITQDLPSVYAGADATSCEDTPYYIGDASAADYSSLLWIRLDADGTFDNNTSLKPTYTFGPGDKVKGYAKLKLVASPVSPCLLLVEDQITITVQDQVAVNAGIDATICQGDNYHLSYASASNYSDIGWYTTLGDGTFSNDDVLFPVYTPGQSDILAGSVSICLVADPVSPCTPSIEDCMTLTINPKPEIESATLQMAYQSGNPVWAAVSGSFAAGYDLCIDGGETSNYILDIDQLSSNNPLAANVYNEFYINPLEVPTGFYAYWSAQGVNIGAVGSGTWQETMWYIVNGTNPVFYLLLDAPFKSPPTNYQLIDGFQKQYNSVDVPMVLPGNYPEGNYTFSGTIQDINGCISDEFDVSMSITHAPFADAGSDATICAGENYTVDDADASDYSSITWTADACPGKGSAADGTFTGETSLTPTYTPGPQDIERGFVCLWLTAEPDSPCTVAAEDVMSLTINPEPDANFCVGEATVGYGDEFEFCYNENVVVTMCEILQGNGPFEVCWTLDDGEEECLTVNQGDELFNDKLSVGTHEIQLTSITDGNGCELSDPSPYAMTIIVHPEPDANFCVNGETVGYGDEFEFCHGDNVNVTMCEILSGEGPFEVCWKLDDGEEECLTVDEGESLYNNTLPDGEHTIELTSITDAKGCVLSDVTPYTMSIEIHPEPALIFAANEVPFYEGAELEYCEGETITLTLDEAVAGTGPFDIAWTVNGDADSAEDVAVGDELFSGTKDPYTYNLVITSITDANGCSVDDVSMYTATIIVNPLPELTSVSLQYGVAPNWDEISVTGDLDNGYQICLDGVESTHYLLDVDQLTSTVDLEENHMNPFYHTDNVPDDFFDYWAARGVDENASGDWKEIMWNIINGDTPIFYLVATYPLKNGYDYQLIDGLQYELLKSPELPRLTIPGNYPDGDYTFKGTVVDINGCTSGDLTMDMEFVHAPAAFAGEDATICNDSGYTLNNATATSYSSVSWSGGAGSFDDPAIVNATYTPATSEIGTTVTLTLTAQPKDPCTATADDSMDLSVQSPPSADAGDDDEICADDSYDVYGSVTNACGHAWSTEGDGTFDDANALETTYNPGANDIANGSVDLCLTATACDPCETDDEDCLTLTINPLPDADFCVNGTVSGYGDEFEVCYDENVKVTMCEILSGEAPFEVCWKLDDGEEECATVNEGDEIYNDLLEVGTHEIQLTSITDANGCSLADPTPYKMTIIVNPEPDADFCVNDVVSGYGDEFEVCYDENVKVTMCEILSGEGPFEVCWKLDDGAEECATVNEGDEIYNDLLEVGTHEIQLTSITDADGCKLADATPYKMTIIVNPEPDANFCINTQTVGYGDEFTFCYDETVNVTLCEILSGEGPFEVCWKLDDGTEECLTVDEGESLYNNTLPVGEHTIELTSITDANGCKLDDVSLYTMSIEIYPEPAVIFAANGEQFYEGAELEYCEDETITLTLDEAVSGTGPFDIEWTVNGDADSAEDVAVGDELFSGTKEPGTYELVITSITDDYGCSAGDVSMYHATIIVHPLPELTTVNLQYGEAGDPPSYTPVSGDIENGYNLCIDGNTDTHYFLDIAGFLSTVTLEPNVMNEFYHTATVPDGFFDYWADRGVVEGATGWKGIMWNIINGDAPIFYLVADTPAKNGFDYQLIDGLQYQNTPSQTVPLTLPGNYPQGDYTFSGTVKDVNGCVSDAIGIDMEFVHAAVADAGQDATITIDQTYVLSDAVAYNYSNVSWGTSGSGSFDDNTLLNPEYTPDASDVGVVTLSLYVNPLAPCQQQATSTMTLTVKVRPEVEITSPADETVIYQWDYTIEGTASDADGTVDKVEVKINDGSWVDATGTDTWTYDATLDQGLNIVKARSQDNDGYYSDEAEISVYVHLQVIPLTTSRYQMISTFLDPADPDVENIMSVVVDDLDVMQSKTEIYAPPPFNINTIGNWDNQTAYGLYMSLETDDEIVVGGDPLDDNSLNLNSGVNYLPVLSDQLSPIDDIFSDPENDILYIFDFSTGFIYWPDGGLYFLTDLVPGRGYLSNFINPVTINYPDYAGYKPVDMAAQQMETLCPWTLTKTGNVHVVSIDQKAVMDIQDADYIGAFDAEGNCIGFADLSIKNSNIPMMLFGDNTWTEVKDGAAEGETINFVAYNSATSNQESITAVFDPDFANHDGTFATGGLSMISNFYKSSIGYAGSSELTPVKIFPNPAKGIVNIETGNTAKDAVVSFMNAEGLVVKTMDVTGGRTRINIFDLAPGVYFVKINVEGQGNVIQKLVIQ